MEALLSSYGDSSSEDDEAPPPKRPCPPQAALPPPPLDDPPAQAALPPPPLDDLPAPSLVGDGRVRQFEHVDGAFAVHVYLPVALGASLRTQLGACASVLQGRAAAGAPVHATEPAEWHVSLSRTVTLQKAQLDAFLDALRVALRRCAAVRASASRFCELPNDTGTRFFAALELERTPAHAEVCRMIDAVDGVLARYGLPKFYAERRLHFSFAWSLAALPQLPGLAGAAADLSVGLGSVACRVGERTTVFELRAARPG